jgi:hypothetical protein
LTSTAGASVVPGKKNEGWAVDALRDRLSRELGPVTLEPGADDSAGEDRLLRLPGGRKVVVQVVTARTDPTHWRDAKTLGSATRSSDPTDIAAELREAILGKVHNSARVDRANTVLALDAHFSPEAAYPSVIASYLAAYGSPEVEFGFWQVWAIAPTVDACRRVADAA